MTLYRRASEDDLVETFGFALDGLREFFDVSKALVLLTEVVRKLWVQRSNYLIFNSWKHVHEHLYLIETEVSRNKYWQTMGELSKYAWNKVNSMVE